MSMEDKPQISIVRRQIGEKNNFSFFSAKHPSQNDNQGLDLKLEQWHKFFDPNFDPESKADSA